MAPSSMPNGPLKESFAKVAAMAPRQKPQAEMSASSTSSLENADQYSTTNTSVSMAPVDGPSATQTKRFGGTSVTINRPQTAKIQDITQSVRALHIEDRSSEPAAKDPDADQHRHATETRNGGPAMEGLNALEPGKLTKSSSLDGKSTTSGATFGMDEKESLRPDDSASAKAADEEDFYTAIAPGAVSSRLGSEHGTRAFRAQFHEIAERIGYPSESQESSPPFPSSVQQRPCATAPDQAEVTSMNSKSSPSRADASERSVPFGFTQLGPDEKLLEALENPKDRLFVLRLEQEVIEFVKDQKGPSLELPPCNSFCRLLIHKLADYYFLTHFVDTTSNCVRLYRTPFCRLPPPLTGISNPPTSGNTPPPGGPAMKIMRRDNLDKNNTQQTYELDAATSSDVSTHGGSLVDGVSEGDASRDTAASSAREKGNLTREQREAKYKEARERIFKGFEETDIEERNAGADDAKQTSRSSSRAGRTKAGKKQRNAADDGFEARSQFAPYYPPPQPPFQSMAEVVPYNSFSSQHFSFQGKLMAPSPVPDFQSYNRGFAQHLPSQSVGPYALPANQLYIDASSSDTSQAFPPLPQSNMGMASLPNMSHQIYPSSDFDNMPFPTAMSGVYFPGVRQPGYPQPQHSNGHWMPHLSNGSFQTVASSSLESSQVSVDSHTEPPQSNGIPGFYPYGQLPNQSYHQGGHRINSQHPIPGSFNRRAFNPQTQPFVPGSKALGGQSSLYGSSIPHMVGPQPNLSQAGNMPLFDTHVHGLNQSITPSLPTGYFLPPNNGRLPSNGLAVSGLTPISHPSKPDQPSPPSTLSRWNPQHNLPAKPPPPTASYSRRLNDRLTEAGSGRSSTNTNGGYPAAGPLLSHPSQGN